MKEPTARHPIRAAIDRLAARFDLANESWMQDWEVHVADPARLDAFLDTYEQEPLTDDERFVLMEVIIQSLEDSDLDIPSSAAWARAKRCLLKDFEIHAYTIWHWGPFDDPTSTDWRITPLMQGVYSEAVKRGLTV